MCDLGIWSPGWRDLGLAVIWWSAARALSAPRSLNRGVGRTSGPAAGLRTSALEEYHRLEAELPGLPVTWSGSLSWGTTESAPTAGPGQAERGQQQ